MSELKATAIRVKRALEAYQNPPPELKPFWDDVWRLLKAVDYEYCMDLGVWDGTLNDADVNEADQ